ncbi:MAG: T9SS type A sorting domain-containing protein [Alphaproteobacteria bacterium]|nr:T9SS type A sorting domain-containing protein [Alphaproteobacteria bacterium]
MYIYILFTLTKNLVMKACSFLISFLIFNLAVTAQPFVEQVGIALTGVYKSSVALGDYDNDGDLDILLSGYSVSLKSQVSKIFKNNYPDNNFTEQVGIALTGVYNSSVAWGDYDNDGDLDILLTGNTGGTNIAKIYRNNYPMNSFTEQNNITLQGVCYSSVAWGDYDNDGDLDILLTGSSISRVYRNDYPNNTFTLQNNIQLYGINIGSAAWGDYDCDGDLDILLSGSGLTKIYRNNYPENSFTEQSAISITGLANGFAAWGDYDNDGDLDIAVTGDNNSYPSERCSRIFRNDYPVNSFTEQSGITLAGADFSSVAWGDYDNDGDLDLALEGTSSEVPVPCGYIAIIYKNNYPLNSLTWQANIPLAGVSDGTINWGDYDRDGDLDLLLTGTLCGGGVYPIAKIYRNEGGAFNTQPWAPSGVSFNGTSFTWNKSIDNETPQNTLTYNVRIGTLNNKDYVKPSMASQQFLGPNIGYRRVVQMGNVQITNELPFLGNDSIPGGYYFSVQAIDQVFAGSEFSNDLLFAMNATLQPTNITPNEVILKGIINPIGENTLISFEYGVTNFYGSSLIATPNIIAGMDNVSVSANLCGLFPNTVYHYRVKSVNPMGTFYGKDVAFTASKPFTITPSTIQNISVGQQGTILTAEPLTNPTSYNWYYTLTSGNNYQAFNPPQTGNTYTPYSPIAQTYYVICKGIANGYEFTSNEVKINVALYAITPGAIQNISNCQQGNVLTAGPLFNPTSYNWYYTLTSGNNYQAFNPPQTGNTYTPFLGIPQTYYVICKAIANGYQFTSNEVRVNVSPFAITPAAIQNICAGQQGNMLTAGPLINATSYNWYYSLFTGNSYEQFVPPQTGNIYTPLFPIGQSYYIICNGIASGVECTSSEVRINVSPYADAVKYNRIEFYQNVTPNTENPENLIMPGKKVRFKLRVTNNYTQNLLTLKGYIRTTSPYITILDSIGTFNNILMGQQGWSFDYYEVLISPNLPPNAELFFLLNMRDEIVNTVQWNSQFSIPFLQISNVYLDDDNFKDSQGNNNKIVQTNETIEILPLVKNKSVTKFYAVNGLLTSSSSGVSIWNNHTGINTLVMNNYQYNFLSSGQIISGVTDIRPAQDYVLEYTGVSNTDLNFNLKLTAYANAAQGSAWDNGGVLMKFGAPFTLLNGQTQSPAMTHITSAATAVKYSRIEFYQNVTPCAENPANLIGPGKKVRFKLQAENTFAENLPTLNAIISSTSNKVTITDNSGTLNNVDKNAKVWTVDEFEIVFNEDITGVGEIEFTLTISDQIINAGPWTSTFKIPLLQFAMVVIDDDEIPDSNGDNDDIAEPGEVVEIIPLIKNLSTKTFYTTLGQLTTTVGYLSIWNNHPGASGLVYDTYPYTTPIPPNTNNVMPQQDFVFDHNGPAIYTLNFVLKTTTYMDALQGATWNVGGIRMVYAIPFVLNQGQPTALITVISPNGGETWQLGATKSITWADNIIENVKIDLYKGGVFLQQISPTTPSNGNYSWLIPVHLQLAFDYSIMITSIATNDVYDFSNGNFEIYATVPSDKWLQNLNIVNGETKCYNALQTITVAGNGTTFTAQSGSNVTMIAGQQIKYLPTTVIQSGGHMLGYIAPSGPYCLTPSMPFITATTDETPIVIEQSSFKIYPNPTTGNFILEMNGESTMDKITLDVYGIWGERIITETLIGERKHEFSLSDRPSGIYFIRVIYGNKAEIAKIIKQ